jgi:hypothetical protein
MEQMIQELLNNNTRVELIDMATEFGLPIWGKKKDIAKRIVRFELGANVEETVKVEDVNNEVIDEEDPKTKEEAVSRGLVIVKMERNNSMYQAIGRTFSRNHPFAAVTEDEANHLIENIKGFRMATPREVERFYE